MVKIKIIVLTLLALTFGTSFTLLGVIAFTQVDDSLGVHSTPIGD